MGPASVYIGRFLAGNAAHAGVSGGLPTGKQSARGITLVSDAGVGGPGLGTAIAGRPCWGAMYGPQAVSEQALTEQILDRLPDRSVFMGDVNFGVFTVAFAATQRKHDMLFRLEASRARALGRGLPMTPGTDEK